jgi:hypothetical protein
MKIPFDLRCDKCGRNLHADLDIATPNPDIVCPCGKMRLRCLVGSTGPDSYPTMVLDRAGYELEKGDCTMAILLSAIAVEIIPSVFALHWKPPVALPDNAIARISKICREYYPMGVEHFVSREHRLNKWLRYDFRTDALQLFGHPRAIIRKIYEAIYEPRNAILHEGKFSYSIGEATKAWNIAVFFYRMVRAMETMKSYEVNPESLDSLFRRAEEEFPPSPTESKA